MKTKDKDFKIGGVFSFSVVRDGQVIDAWDEDNIIVDEGLNYALDTSFSGGTPITTWYIGLFKNSYVPIASNIMATFPSAGVANEATTEYLEATRPAWVEAGVANKVITNSASPAVFNVQSSVTVQGSFLSSSSVKGGTAGVLSAAAKFAAPRVLEANDVLNIVYTLTISST
jgi:hypothetical protein